MSDSHSQLPTPGPSLVVGGDGKIGRKLLQTLKQSGAEAVGTTRREGEKDHIFLDLDDRSSWKNLPGSRVAFLCAGVSSIEVCENDPVGTSRLNVKQMGDLAACLADQGSRLVLISSNRVFDGQTGNMSERAPTCPQTEYGRQKMEIESRMLSLPDSVILRVSKVLFPDDTLITNWLDTLGSGEAIQAASDMYISPVSADLAVNTLLSLSASTKEGIYQLSAPEDISYFDVARLLAGSTGSNQEQVNQITRQQLVDAGRFDLEPEKFAPRHTTLDISRLRADFDLQAPDATETIREAFGLPETAAT
jgi:dTDP-4-dehydrorhamnose reductase